ncbi:MAG TPA: SAM-dependent chlorinase/fluorinase [Acidimicrobiia bacterium]
MSGFVSFLSDFGLKDEFVGVVHGVIGRIAPDVRTIDVTHGIPSGDIRAGALALTRAVQYLPEGVVLAVVDPGVGTARRAIAAETERGFFVGPDNGLLSPAVALVGGAGRIVSLENPDFRIPSVGATFHGRDVFAPAAAVLASGEADLADLGPSVDPETVTPLLLPLPEVGEGFVSGRAWWIDRFGNVQTNIGPEEIRLAGIDPDATITVKVGASEYEVQWVTAYGDVEEGDLLLHVDSAGLIALAVRGGDASEALNLASGMALTLAG